MTKTKELSVRIADNGNVIIDGVNYGGQAVAAGCAIKDKKGKIHASCITNVGGIWKLGPRGGWNRVY